MLPEDLRSKLKVKLLQEKGKLQKKHAHAIKYFQTKNFNLSKVREHSAKAISAGALATALLLSPPVVKNLPPSDVTDKNKVVNGVNVSLETPQERLLTSIKSILPSAVRPLTPEEEKKLETVFNSTIGVPSKANLEGEHLNTTYGLIGAEQHLRRYPGDVMGTTHPALASKDEGMAPGLGAWGYFSSSKDKLTPDLIEKEKWYAVVQTLYLPDWQKRLPYLREWYKYRKVLIVNTTNGNAVVADVADSGPAAFTGKSFGGSPEVMNYLGGTNYKKGPVVLFFVDDPNNKIPLGPVEYNKIVEDLAGLNVQAL